MAKHVMISLVLVAMTGALFGCSDSTTEPVQTAEAPMIAPVNVFATVTPTGVSISWDASSQSTLKGYNVYRIDEGSSTIAKLNSAALTANTYLDQATQWGVSYEYRVTTVSVKNAESVPASVTIDNAITRDVGNPRPND